MRVQSFRAGLYGLGFILSFICGGHVFAAEPIQFLDSAASGNQYSATLTISKDFDATGTHRYLVYTFASSDDSVNSVTWNGTTMTQLLVSDVGNGQRIRAYGLADPDVGASHNAVATMSSGGTVYDGAILLYAGASSTQLDAEGDFTSESSATESSNVVTTVTPGSIVLSVIKHGGDSDPVPGGDALLRASEYGVITGTFGVLERGPFNTPGSYSVTSTFPTAGYLSKAFSLAPANPPDVPSTPSYDVTVPTFVDEATAGQQQNTPVLTISKDFEATGTHMYLIYTFVSTDDDMDSVTWNGTTMTQLQVSGVYTGQKIYTYGLADPEIGAAHEAVATISGGGSIFDGALLLYTGASSTQLDAQGDFTSGADTQAIGSVVTVTPGAAVISVIRNGGDSDPVPGGDASLRASEHGVITGTFGVLERGPVDDPGEYSVSSTFPIADYLTSTFSLAPAVPLPTVPTFLDSAASGNQYAATLTISKTFEAVGTHMYLVYTFATSDDGVDSVTWNGTTMTQLLVSDVGNGQRIRTYGLADPDVGASHNAVATMSSGGTVYDGAILLYAGASSTQLDAEGDFASGSSATESSNVVTTVTPGSIVLSAIKQGADTDATPGGDAVLRASEAGVITGTFSVIERGPFNDPGEYTVSSTFPVAGYLSQAFSLAPAIATVPPPRPNLIDMEALASPGNTLTITKNFSATGTDPYLFYTFQADDHFGVNTVTWHGAAMTLLQVSETQAGMKTYLYGLADPDVGASYDAVADMVAGGRVYTGMISLYASS